MTREPVKLPVVVGENIGQKVLMFQIQLPVKAQYINDVKTEIVNLETKVIKDRVMVNGYVDTVVLFVGEDKAIHRSSNSTGFNLFTPVPGARPGMNLFVEPEIEQIESELTEDRKVIEQKLVVQFFIKVLKREEFYLKTGQGPLVRTERIVGETQHQLDLKNKSKLAVKLNKLLDLDTRLQGLEYKIKDNRILIQGTVKSDLYYMGEDGIKHHQEVSIPFNENINFAGAEQGMTADIEYNILHADTIKGEENQEITEVIILEFNIMVLEQVQLKIPTGDGPLVMVSEVIGENTGELLKQLEIPIQNKIRKISRVDPTIIALKGVLIEDRIVAHGEIKLFIYYIGNDGIEYIKTVTSPFNTLINLAGTRTGMESELEANTAYIDYHFNPSKGIINCKIIIEVFAKVFEKIQFNIVEEKEA
ncbi:hypothetical protein Hore_21430 [Halothermothrix orenii H 168]|uniref:SipL SPOCS domain-containing protein n=2 Tax=Halothermothrix orenii TaxID=31909 RepID=B8D0F2_HALOH|nr:hypothetical protein Hore_21430 [Halothermothrix orenii H 168]